MCEKEPESTGKKARLDRGPLTPLGEARLENAAGKKLCGMCEFRNQAVAPGHIWRCLKELPCPWWPEPDHPCINYFRKTQKIKPLKKGELPRLPIPAGVRFLFIGRPKAGNRHHGVVTVAYIVVKKPPHLIELAFSFCSPKDQWIKATGRDMAVARLMGSALVIPYLYEPRRLVIQIAQAMMEHRFQEVGQLCSRSRGTLPMLAPSWTREMAGRIFWGPRLKKPPIGRVPKRILSIDPANHSMDAIAYLLSGYKPMGIMARMLQDIATLDARLAGRPK